MSRAALFGVSGHEVAHVRIVNGRPQVIARRLSDEVGTGATPKPGRIAWWTVPVEQGPEPGDLLVWGELAWRLAGRCGPGHWAWRRYEQVAEQAATAQGADPADTVASHEVWSSALLTPGELARLLRGAR